EGVTGNARAWVNGVELDGHHGGFTIWNREITQLVRAGEFAWLTVSVEEPTKETSTNTYTGGIIRDVKLLALPTNHLTRFHLETDLDESFRDATLRVWTAGSLAPGGTARVELTLTAPDGAEVALTPAVLELRAETGDARIDIPVTAPLLWEAEHPHLYRLRARLVVNGREQQTLVRHVGFREITLHGQRLLVNGQPVKLHGAAQFDGDALLGTTLLPADAERDVKLYKAANMNFVRPSSYPATQAFLDACDRYGLFVEAECPVTFTRGAESDPKLTPIFLQQTAEMIESDRSHPSIIIWQIANESDYGPNIRKMYEYIKAEDPTRPIVYSWSHAVPPDEPLPYDIYSYHYPPYDADLGKAGVAVFNSKAARELPTHMPVLADEIAHVATYNRDELQRDPNVRNFWGESIRVFWDKVRQTEGSLGGAIWAGIDHPIFETRVFAWGLWDVWRRPKPEFWHTKKALSPVRLHDERVENPGAGQPLELSVTNAYDFTNLHEVWLTWSVNGEAGTQRGPDVAPRASGTLRLPARPWHDGEVINLTFRGRDGGLIDEYNVAIGNPVAVSEPEPPPSALEIREEPGRLVVSAQNLALTFNQETKLLERGEYRGQVVLTGGPILNVLGADLQPWAGTHLSAAREDEAIVVRIAGNYGPVGIRFELRVDGHGRIDTRYTLDTFPVKAPETAVVPWNRTHAGGFAEVGVAYVLASNVDRLAWRRKGLWSAYPADHIGRNQGVAFRTGPGIVAQPGVEPHWPFAHDEKDFNLVGPDDAGGRGTADFRSMKEYIREAWIYSARANSALLVESDAAVGVRLEVVDDKPDGNVRILINNAWNYPQLGLGNYMKPPVIIDDGYTAQVRMRLTAAPAP
ncbi:MAG TPA: glycoside hydrolase family 2 TIM barrel-domain containing protein, partial [Candidatus Synoicihabitans sp.]|nr:glycoside hydrolase family 2 TIM barrel-domain containing protein [Candidatus Synoicihabitans sp.]